MQAGKWVIGAALLLGLLPQAARAEYWRYETDSGSIAFTDDAKNIPAKYREHAQKIAEQSLDGYRRLSIVQKQPALTLKSVAPDPGYAGYAQAPMSNRIATEDMQPGQTIHRLGINVSGVQVDIDADSNEPIYVDKSQWVDREGDYFDHGGVMAPTTVIRQGGRTLAYIDER